MNVSTLGIKIPINKYLNYKINYVTNATNLKAQVAIHAKG